MNDGRNDKNRTQSINLLAYILSEIPHLMLEDADVYSLTTFFIQKLKDRSCTFPAIFSLHSIMRYHTLSIKKSNPEVHPILKTIFLGLSPNYFHVPSFAQEIRFHAF